MIVPEKLYHATTTEKAVMILKSGAIKPLGIDRLIYFADTFAGAVAFSYTHGVCMEDIVVIEVDTTKLNKNLFDYGHDHNPDFYKGIEVYTYPEEISDNHITNYLVPNIKEKENEKENE